MRIISSMLILLFIASASNLPAQIDESKYYQYLHEAFSRHEDDVFEYLIREFNTYLATYPESANNDEVLYMLGDLYLAEREVENAFCTFLKLKFLYPQSTRINDIVTSINDIVHNKAERTFRDYKVKVDEIVTNTPNFNNRLDAYYGYLQFLFELRLNDLNKFLMSDIQYYLHTFPKTAKNSDQLFLWIAELYQKDNEWDEAIYTNYKISHLYPDSPLMPEVLFQTAYIQYRHKGSYPLARDSFVRVITDYPQSESAGEAQFYLAELYQERLDNTAEAIANYRLLVETYPQNWHAVEALKRIAEMHADSEKYQEAVAAYYQIYELYPDNAYTPNALIEIRDLYTDRLNMYDKAIEILKLFATQYATREDAAECLYEAAEIYEDDLGNKQSAIDLYHEVKNKFPNSKYAERAQDRIEDLSQE